MTEIAKTLLGWLRKIGRWILGRVVRTGALALGYYMRERANGVFTQRLARAKTPRRKRWLTGRIKRWRAAGTWLIAWADDVGKCVANEVDALTRKSRTLPLVAACERLGRAA